MNEDKPNIEIVKELIRQHAVRHRKYVKKCQEADRYYRNANDIIWEGTGPRGDDPMRHADNRIPRNFHGLLVNQKAAYMFTAPPLFDVGRDEDNKKITEALGDAYPKICKDLCVNASNTACSWLHYWDGDEGGFHYAVVPSAQIIPVYSRSLENELIAVLRTYQDINYSDGKEITVWEYWDHEYCYAYYRKSDSIAVSGLENYDMFFTSGVDDGAQEGNRLQHGKGRVPFIPFYNNNIRMSDLDNIKPLVDAYDKVFSGFLNDLEDIQEVIYVLTNYGGADLDEFLDDLKKYKAVKIDKYEGGGGSGGVETLTVNIPVEAREKFLELTRKAIFEQGQGVDPDPQKFGNASGEALKYLYSLLELKAGLMETEFRLGFGELIRAICGHLGIECKSINQTWARSAIKSDSELAEICSKSDGIISRKTLIKNHPFVKDAEAEEKQIQKEREDAEERASKMYVRAFQKEAEGSTEDEAEGDVKNGG